jgi:hypothetical protein
MVVSQNGWSAVWTGLSPTLTSLRWITGKVRSGNVHTIFDYLGERFHKEVEPITKAHSWGWANRSIRGASTLSNHASGTAVDFNAPKHPLGAWGTFKPAQVTAIRRILKDLDGVVRWGGEWSRPDEMHFEIVGSASKVAAVARKIKTAKAPKPSTPSVVKGLVEDSKWGSATTRRAQQVAGTPDDGKVSGQERQHRNRYLTTGWEWVAPGAGKGSQLIARLQQDLKKKGLYKGKIDGIAGPGFWVGFKKAQKEKTIKAAVRRFQMCLNEGRFWTIRK